MTLEKVLFTVLNATHTELEGLKKARRKNNQGLLSYFYTPNQSTVAKPMQVRKKKDDVSNMSMEFE